MLRNLFEYIVWALLVVVTSVCGATVVLGVLAWYLLVVRNVPL